MNLTKNTYRALRWLRIFLIVVLIYACILIIVNMAEYGGDLVGWTRVKDFSLCNLGENAVSNPMVLSTTGLSPTSIVRVCGYLEMKIKNPAARPVGLAFYLWRDNNLVYAQEYVQDTPGYFSVAIRTDELLSSGIYRIRVIDTFRRNWEEVATFEIR